MGKRKYLVVQGEFSSEVIECDPEFFLMDINVKYPEQITAIIKLPQEAQDDK